MQQSVLHRLDDLAGGLQQRVSQILSGAPGPDATQQTKPIVAPNGRTVFLAKPASDMKAAYVRLVTELQGKGFTVAPDPSADMPSDSSASAFVADALASAEIFVHLVGDSEEFAPEGLDNIVKLQLAQARAKAAQTEGPPGQKVNRRIVGRRKFSTKAGRLSLVRRSSAIR